MADKVQIPKSKALSLMLKYGWKSISDKWTLQTFAEKIVGIADLPKKELEEADAATYIQVMAAIEEKSTIEIVDDAPATTTEGGKKPEKEPKKEAAKKEPKPPKEPAAPAVKYGPPGLRVTNTRETIAARILKREGLDKGVTPAMIEEVDKIYGKANKDRSWSALISAWHSINGYTDTYPIKEEVKAEPAKEEVKAEPAKEEAKTETKAETTEAPKEEVKAEATA